MRLRRIVRPFQVRPRLLMAAAAAGAAAFLLPEMRWSTRAILSWDVGIGLHLALLAIMMARSNLDNLQVRADEDAGAAAVLGIATVAAVASLAAIGAELDGLKDAAGAAKGGRLALAGATILLSWLYVNAMFGIHYAHEYYRGKVDRQGLKFPGDGAPDYWDFMYFAFNMGAAAQTSDVAVEDRRMRRFVLAHTVVSFLFNTTILALAINVGASLL